MGFGVLLMAGEWIAVDLAMPEKPEVQELIDTTGQSVEVVCFRLWKLWGWASMHCTDGSARMTLPRLVRTCGADESFWRAVAAVGWLEIDEAGGSVAVPGWDRRFSQCAKSRMQQSDRSRAHEDRNPGRKRQYGASDAPASDGPTADRRRGEERRIPPPPREASQPEAWEALRRAWNSGAGPATRRNPWKPANPPDHAAAVIVQDGWLAAGWRKADPVVYESAIDGGVVHERVIQGEMVPGEVIIEERIISPGPVVHDGVIFESAAEGGTSSGSLVLSQP